MLESIISVFNAAKQSTPTFLLGIIVAAGALLLLPVDVVKTLGLDGFVRDRRSYVGGAFVIAISLLAAQGFVWAIGLIKSQYTKVKVKQTAALSKQRRLESLSKLTPEEKGYLLPYIVQEKNTMYFRLDDGIASGLQAKEIIYRAANVGDMLTGFAFNITSWAKEHLATNPHLLDDADTLPTNRGRF
jgi:hypothetical protein